MQQVATLAKWVSLPSVKFSRQLHWVSQQSRKVNWSQSNSIFKDYFSRRLTISAGEVEAMLQHVTQLNFSESDHRWSSMLHHLEKTSEKFTHSSKVYLIKALMPYNSAAPTREHLLKLSRASISQFNFEECAVLLWCMGRQKSKAKVENIAQVFKRITTILEPLKDPQTQRVSIVVKPPELPDQQTLVTSPAVLNMILSAMVKLRISDDALLRTVIKDGIKPNIEWISIQSLCTVLHIFKKLGLINKRDTLTVYRRIRLQHKQLETVSNETLMNLIWSVSALTNRVLSQAEQKNLRESSEQRQKLQKEKQDTKTFLMWLCQTLLLRGDNVSLANSAQVLHCLHSASVFDEHLFNMACGRLTEQVQDCKLIDLVMAVRALASLSQSDKLKMTKMDSILQKRLWQLHSSLNGKSLQVIGELYQRHKIKPPAIVVKKIIADFEQRQARSSQGKKGQQAELEKEQ